MVRTDHIICWEPGAEVLRWEGCQGAVRIWSLWLDLASLSSQPTEAFLSLCVEKNCRVSQKCSWTFWRAHYNWNRSSGKMYVRLRVAGNERGIVRQQFLCHWLMDVLDNTCALGGLTGFRNSPENWERPEWKSPSRWRWEPWPQITASSQIYIVRVPREETCCVSPAFKNIHFFLKMLFWEFGVSQRPKKETIVINWIKAISLEDFFFKATSIVNHWN